MKRGTGTEIDLPVTMWPWSVCMLKQKSSDAVPAEKEWMLSPFLCRHDFPTKKTQKFWGTFFWNLYINKSLAMMLAKANNAAMKLAYLCMTASIIVGHKTLESYWSTLINSLKYAYIWWLSYPPEELLQGNNSNLKIHACKSVYSTLSMLTSWKWSRCQPRGNK